MGESITLRYKNTEKEYCHAMRIYYAHSLRTKVDIFLSLVVLIAGITFTVIYGYSTTYIGAIVAGMLMLGLMYAVNYIVPAINYRRQPKFWDEYELTFTADNIGFKTEHINSTLEWATYNNVWDEEKFYFLFYGKQMFSFIPKRAFNKEQEAAFRNLLASKGLL